MFVLHLSATIILSESHVVFLDFPKMPRSATYGSQLRGTFSAPVTPHQQATLGLYGV